MAEDGQVVETTQSTGGDAGAAATVSTPSTPAPVRLSEDTLIQLEGMKEPVKYADHFRGLKSELTKRSQELSRIGPDYRRLKQLEAEWQRREAAMQGRQTPQPDPLNEMLAKIEGLNYLDGKTSKEVLGAFSGEVGRLKQELATRDQILLGVAQYIANMEKQVNGLLGARSENELNAKVSNLLKEKDLGDEWRDFVLDLYAGYEAEDGDDIDGAVARLLDERVAAAERAIEAKRRRALEQRRQQPFVPGKGGQGAAGRPLSKKFETPREVAARFFGKDPSEID